MTKERKKLINRERKRDTVRMEARHIEMEKGQERQKGRK
jgi:hypothetical protein